MKPSRHPILARGTTPAGYGYDLATAADGKAPTEFRIFANGVNTSDKGDFVFDETAAKSVMAAFGKKGAHLTMDYEHQAFNSASNGQPAPNSAKAWTPEVRLDASGKPELWATNVQWTQKAAGMIESGEYNHFSPAFEADPKTMRVERIVNMALTNIPALDNQAPLIAANQGEIHMAKSMKCKLCQKSLKAPDGDEDGDEVMCTDHAVIPKMAAVFGLSGASESVLLGAATDATNFRSTVLQLVGAKNPVEALGLIGTLKGKDAEIVTLRTQIETDAARALTVEWERVLDEAGKAGKLAPDPAVREKFTKPLLALSGGKVTREAIDFASNHFATQEAKVNVTDKDGAGGKTPAGDAHAAQTVSESEAKIAMLTGVAQVDIIEHKKLEAQGKFKAGVERPLKYIIMG